MTPVDPPAPTPAGLLLAAGAGSRMGMPKALVHDDRGAWLQRGVEVLRQGGCDPVVVVLGAAPEAAELLDGSVQVVVAEDWAEGMGASLRAGLAALAGLGEDVPSVVVSLVDLPDLVPQVVARVVGGAVGGAGAAAGSLARAAYDGVPGHPVLLGRDHWAGVAAAATGDRGARDYLATADVVLVECGDLASGRDVDSR
ncbi:NTP transferase domain-containing protein [Nocardioides sp. REDSEA-S30_B4]|uniref:nucleotidyltransferase family protein n=1 Tax=Nocardioides sp. REDSEA-S30_B4 TaxID=1811552 RepID=UPI000A83CFB1|nr:NTP transferase domain-containing protein [Nocardioides sp. REDSEA-S30_B4]